MISVDFGAILTSLVGMAATGLVGYLVGIARERSTTRKAEREILSSMALKDIEDCHERYVVRKEKMTIARRERIVKLCHGYTTLYPESKEDPIIISLLAVKPYQVID